MTALAATAPDGRRAPGGRLALVTVTDAPFALGTAVMLSSFLRHNPWFDGDLIGITEQPNAALHHRFRAFPRFSLRSPSAGLSRQVAVLAEAWPVLGRRRSRFYSLDCFGLTGYDRVLFLDSDMVCLQSLAPLFDTDGEFIACPDRSHYRGLVRDPVTFRSVSRAEHEGVAPTFNAGMMCIAGSLLSEEVHEAVLDLVTPATFSAVESGHTDQVILNQYLAPHTRMVSSTYNFLVPDAALIEAQDGISTGEAALLHFAGPTKPWAIRAHLRNAVRGQRPSPSWHQWAEALAHYRRQVPASPDGLREVLRYGGARVLSALTGSRSRSI